MEHVLFGILWEAGLRIGAVRSLDVDDVVFEDERLELVHRPDQGTTLKNGPGGERLVALSSELAGVVRDHVERLRHDITDEYDHEPLITSEHGRLARSSIRRVVYKVIAPCYRNEPCLDCVGTDGKCGDSVSPHAVRRGSITHYRSNDVPVEIVSDRMNVSRKVLDKHYDQRTEEVKLEQRREYLGNV